MTRFLAFTLPNVDVSTLAGWTFVVTVLAVSLYVMVKGKDD